MRLRNFFFVLLCISLLSLEAFGHARLNFPVPRDDSDSWKNGPCGNAAPRTAQVFQGGETITVTWEETINHPGRYYISWSQSNQDNFAANRLAEVLDTQDGQVNRQDPNSWHQYSQTVTLPNIQCDSCVLQLIQSMEEIPAAPSLYYSCADIRIQASGTDPTPNPEPVDDNNNNDNSAQDTNDQTARQAPKMGSCGTIGNNGNGPGPQGPIAFLLLVMPIILIRRLRII